MTPDELFTRMHIQRADIGALQSALCAFMIALPPELQQKVLAAHQAMQQIQLEALAKQAADATTTRAVVSASQRLHSQLDNARKALVPND